MSSILNEGIFIHPANVAKAGVVVGGGPGLSSRIYQKFLPEIFNDLPLTTWDYRGTGHSAASKAFSADQDYKDFCMVLNKFHNSEPVTVFAHSYGCALALRLATEQPERIKRLILVSGALSFAPVMKDIIKRKYQNMRLTDFVQLVGIMFSALLFGETLSMNRKFIKLELQNQFAAISKPKIDELSEYYDTCLKALMSITDFAAWDFSQSASLIKAPTLVIGGESDIVVPPEFSRDLAARIPGSQYHLIRDSAHWPFIEQQMAFRYRITEFIRD